MLLLDEYKAWDSIYNIGYDLPHYVYCGEMYSRPQAQYSILGMSLQLVFSFSMGVFTTLQVSAFA